MANQGVRVKCRRHYMTTGSTHVAPERVYVVRRDTQLPGYFIVQFDRPAFGNPRQAATVAMHETWIGEAAQ